MKTELLDANKILIKLSKHELLILNNALNEVCHALNLSEFQTRMGSELEEVQELLSQIREAVDLIEGRS